MTAIVIAFVLAQSLDTSTSCVGFSRGWTEANPMLPNTCGRLVAVKAGITVGTTLPLVALSHTRPRLAFWLTAAAAAVTATAGARNMMRLRA